MRPMNININSSIGRGLELAAAPLTVLRTSMSRDELFAGVCILGCVNGIAARVIEFTNEHGWWNSLFDSFGVSAIVWISCFVAIALIIRERSGEIRPVDLGACAGLFFLILLPVGWASWLAMTALAIYILAFTNASSGQHRVALILLAVTMPMLWSRSVFQLFASFILEIDATLVSTLTHTVRVGTMVQFVDGSGYLVIFPTCSSLANVSLAFLCWVTISQALGHRWKLGDIAWCLLACLSVIAVNVTRMGLMALSDRHYEAIHSNLGELITNLIMLGLVVGFCVLGVRREILSRT